MRRNNKKRALNYARVAITLFVLAFFVMLLTVIISQTMSKPDDINKNSSTSNHSITTLPPSNITSDALSNPISRPNEAASNTPSETQLDYKYSIDIEPYLSFIEPDRSGDKNDYWLIIANKTTPLPDSFVPPDLVDSPNAKPGTANPKLDRTTSKALEALLKEAAACGFTKITMSSGYRSYSTQKWWFNPYKDKYRARYNTEAELEEYVNSFSLRAGTSEHQTGLTADIYDTAENTLFNDTPAALWLAENAHKFGFILRYPKNKQHITGIVHESWHFRFVGRSAATIIYENDWTLEEYHSER